MTDTFIILTNQISKYIIPFLLVGIPFYGLIIKKIKVYESFVDGAKDGFDIALRIIPYLVAILVAIGMFRASGAMEMFISLISPIFGFGFLKDTAHLTIFSSKNSFFSA